MSDKSLKATVQDDLTSAIRGRDQVRAGTLRLALTAITNGSNCGPCVAHSHCSAGSSCCQVSGFGMVTVKWLISSS